MSTTGQADLGGRIAVVTGGGLGIGAGLVRALADHGAAVVVNDVDEDSAKAVAASVTAAGGEALPIAADISTVEGVDDLFDTATKQLGPIDILVNNAAITRIHRAFVDHTVEEWDRVFAVNVRGVFLCSRKVLPSMLERRRGNIVNIASISAFNTTAPHIAYAASKAAVVTMTRDLASEVAPFGVRVNAVAPGPIDSYDQYSEPFAGVILPRPGKPADIANAVVFLVSDAASFIVGETVRVAGGSDLRVHRDKVTP